ncbi:MAG: beta strand repeat-containing protein, partial [Bacteroidota bacterium]
LNSNSVAATCGSSNGSFVLSANGGTAPYLYSGNGGSSYQPGGSFPAIGPGNYSVMVTDASGCSSNGTVVVANSAAPVVASAPVTNVSCNGLNNGSITINVAGGTSPISYSINGGFTTSTNNSFNNLAPGAYSILVTDGNGCTGTSTANIIQPAAITLSTTTSNASCGNNDGSANITASGGSGALTYSLNGSAAQPSGLFGNLGAGSYNVVVTDQSGCTATIVASVSNNAAPIISNVNNTNINCYGNTNGTISISAAGGTAPLSYSINNGLSYQSASTFNSLPGGTYSISVLDANGCVATSNISISEPAQLNISTLAANATCGNANGSITSLVSGGVIPYNYSINNGATNQPTGTFVGLSSGGYTVLITDNNGCTTSSTSNIQNIGGPVALPANINNVTCFGLTNGSITANSTGGTTPFAYSINGGNSQPSNYFGGLNPGSYSITISDANGCTTTISSNITSPSQLTMSTTTTGSTCGNTNGTVSISASGGSGSYTFSNNGGLSYQPISNFNNLSAGTYTVMVMDANGCTASGSSNVASAPGPILSAVNFNNVNCYNGTNGSITVSSSNGTAPLSYSINQGLPQASNAFNNLTAGTYNILISDANGCTASSSQLITQPSALLTSTSSTPSTCFNGTNGSASVSVSGGTAPYSYIWSGSTNTGPNSNNLSAGSYSVTVSDNNGCSSSMTIVVSNMGGPTISSAISTNNNCYQSNDGTATVQIIGGTGPFNYTLNGTVNQSSGTFQNLPAGTATILVTDNNGCTASNIFTITQPTPVTISGSSTNSSCGNSNGAINLVATGGTSPYSFSNNGGLSYQSNPVFSNLNAGSYSTSTSDANGCTASSSQTIIDLAGPSISSVTPSNPACFNSANGTINIVAIGNGPLNFSLNNGTTFQQNPVFSGLSGGSYNILVSDTNGCLSYSNTLLVEPDPMIATATTSPSICNNSTNGAASVSAQGGQTPYSFIWNTGSTSSTVVNIAAGNYTVTITDANGCTLTQSAIVSNISGPTISSITTTNNSCYQSSNDSAAVAISSGTGPFNFNLNGSKNQSNGSFSNLPAGPGTVLVTDNNGCTTSASFSITEPGPLTLTSQNSSSTCGNSNASITVTAAGGTGPYQYSNNGGGTYQIPNIFLGLGAGSFNLSVIDANGCLTNSTEVVSDLAGPIVSSTSITNPSCFSYTNGSISVFANGNGPLTYSINNGSTSQSNTLFQNLGAGVYSILVTDTNGCTTIASSTLSQPSLLSVLPSTTPSYCDGGTNGSASLNVQGGTTPYTYQWSNGVSSSSNNNLPAGTYSITVTDANGCTQQQSAIVTNVPSPTVSSLNTINNSCYQHGDGT